VSEAPAPALEGWLTLQEASARLDVHPATLRQWADRGRVRTYRTPGGHRRFSAEDVNRLASSLLPQLPPELDLLLTSALGRTRLEASAGRLAVEDWYARLGRSAREQHRALGRELLTLLVRHLQPGPEPGVVVGEAREIGRRYAVIAREGGLSLPEAVRAFLLFRDLLVETALQARAVQDRGRSVRELLAAHRQVGSFLDEVLIALLEAYGKPAG
jgi:excisionase family DNA binding protein